MTKKTFEIKGFFKKFDLLVVPYLIIALGIICLGVQLYCYHSKFNSTIPSSTYQAVFLSNGQVYIGHLESLNRSFMILNDVYYIQEFSNTNDDNNEEVTDNSSQFTLIHIGEELHQPNDSIILNKEHILYWQNIKTNSRIIEAIKEDKEK